MPTVEKLVDVFGTKYFAAHWAAPVEAYLNKNNSADLGGARICTDVMNSILTYQKKGAHLIDSEDPNRDRILRENARRRTLVYNAVKLSAPKSIDDVGDYIERLNPDIVYAIPTVNLPFYVPLAVLIQIFRPEIKMDMDPVFGIYFKYVASKLYPNSHKWTEFYWLTGSTFDNISMQEDGTFKVPFEGNLSYEEFHDRYFAIPYELGNEWIADKPEWSTFIDNVLQDFTEQLNPEASKLKDYL